MKDLLNEWGTHIFVGIVIFGLGAGNIYQSLSHTSTKLEDQIEFIDLMKYVAYTQNIYNYKIIGAFKKDFWKEFLST